MTIELRQLRYFIAVAEEMHFGRAAARLHMTQPPLSQAIQSLEAVMGAQLFTRGKRQIGLTAAGQALLPEAQRLLQQALSLPDLVRRVANGEAGRLTLAFVTTADYGVLPSLLREFRLNYPAVELDLREATTDVQLEQLGKGLIDAGLLIPPLPERLVTELDYVPVLREPLVVAIPDGTPGTQGNHPVSLAQLRDLPLIIFPRHVAPAFHDAILSCFRDAGVTPQIGQEAIQMQTIVALVSAGMGIALVPQSVSNLKRPGVAYRPLSGAAPLVETGLAWRKENASPVLYAFLDLLRKKKTC